MAKKPVTVEFTGAESLQEIFSKMPQKYAKKPLVATMRKGARVFVKELRAQAPKKTGETRRSIGVKAGKGASITVGFRTGGSYMPAWFKAYWSNYGTLSNRAGSHKFKKQRSQITKNHKGGIRASGFVESSWEKTRPQVDTTIMNELKSETDKFLNKYAIK